jgi:3D (Asp-Asp-Asp) domain-containing protein
VIADHAHHARPHHVRHHFPHRIEATAYSPCSSGSVTALGTPTRWGIVASNRLRLRTWIEVKRPVHGRRRFRVEDTGSAAMRLDFWMPSCSAATVFGRRTVRFRVLPHGLRSR